MRKSFLSVLSIFLCSTSMAACAPATSTTTTTLSEPVTLVIAGPWADCPAIETLAGKIKETIPNLNLNYEYLQNFDENISRRLEADNDKVDLFLSNTIHEDSSVFDQTFDLSSIEDQLHLENTYPGLMENVRLQTTDPELAKKFYSIPLGAEVRGLYVNKTLLASVGLSVPTNRAELFEACKTLSEHGYIPLQGNPGFFATKFLYPFVCNNIVNQGDYEANYAMINEKKDGYLELLRDPLQLMYDLMSAGYYDYKTSQTDFELGLDMSDEGNARDFFNLKDNGDGTWTKIDDIGRVAFLPSNISTEPTMNAFAEDYHSEIDYEFIMAPVAEDGAYAYLSPGRTISVNSKTDHIEEVILLLNYLFTPENNIEFCSQYGLIPNTENALDLLNETYAVPSDHVSQVGQVTFQYDFYTPVSNALIEVSKGNNPKYMEQDASGNTTLYSFEHYMEKTEEFFNE